MLKHILILWVTTASIAHGATKLPEEIVFIPKKLLIGSLSLEATIFKPDGDGPFPLVIINHGKSPGLTSSQARYRPLSATRYFLERNYVVIAPMRQGFSKSGGVYLGGHCSMEVNGANQAEDVAATIDYAHTLPYVEKERTLVLGQSHGGWTTLAYGANGPDKSIKGLVNFAGGLKNESCVDWQRDLYKTAGKYGIQTSIPSIWFYGDNDSFFNKELFHEMFDRYHEGNPQSTLIAYGNFESDSHTLFSNRKGRAIWEPPLTEFLEKINMPSKLSNSKYSPAPATPYPPKTDFASIDDIDKVPYLKARGRDAYKLFLTKTFPKAFVINEKGIFAWEAGGEDPIDTALSRCESRANEKCKVYAVDDFVVW